jgi:homoserine O-acetyltransferase
MKITAEKISFKDSLTLQSGHVLSGFELMTETYGELNSDKTNAVLVCHAFSGNHHAAGIKDGEKNLVGGMKSLEMAKQLIQKNFLLSL